MKFTKLLSFTALSFLLISFLTGCDTTNTNPEPGEGNVALQFKTISGNTSAKTVSSGITTSSSHDSLVIEGSNGTLRIDDIRFIVAKFKLEAADSDNDSVEVEPDEFESKAFWVDLPLGEETLSLGNSAIQAGLYEELEFEVEDLDFDDGEEGEEQEHTALADSIRTVFPEWPDEASMVITGSFTPSDGDPQSFNVFAEAEIEIEREFEPPLEITEENVQQVVSVRINPTRWLQQEDGSVYDLSQYDWSEYGELLEFEAEFEDGVEEIEVDEDDFDDDEDEDDEDDNDD